MIKKITPLLIVIIITVSLLSFASAENDTEFENITNKDIDLSNYILAKYSGLNNIEFSDNYMGFAIELSKNPTSSQDPFSIKPTNIAKNSKDNSNIGNYLKQSVIEHYKSNSLNDIGNTISIFSQEDYKNSNNEIVQKVLNSNENVDDNNVVIKINNETEATFNFEVLTPVNNEISSYFAYNVQLKNISKENNDEKLATNDLNNSSQNNLLKKEVNQQINNISKETNQNNTLKNSTNNTSNSTKASETVVNKTNKTIPNKTNEIIINEYNTTIINQNNVKTINNTTNDTPNHSIAEKIMHAAGNPIAILIAVVILGGAIAIVLNKKD